MARRVFYTFHYEPDNWRVSQIRNIGTIEGNRPATDNDWETIKRGGDSAIKSWINGQMNGRSCAIVLIGSNTANRKWINYEITEAWNYGMGVLGIYIHNLKDSNGNQCTKGENPFNYVKFNNIPVRLSSVVQAYDSPSQDSKRVYNYIENNLAEWVEESIHIRSKYSNLKI